MPGGSVGGPGRYVGLPVGSSGCSGWLGCSEAVAVGDGSVVAVGAGVVPAAAVPVVGLVVLVVDDAGERVVGSVEGVRRVDGVASVDGGRVDGAGSVESVDSVDEVGSVEAVGCCTSVVADGCPGSSELGNTSVTRASTSAPAPTTTATGTPHLVHFALPR